MPKGDSNSKGGKDTSAPLAKTSVVAETKIPEGIELTDDEKDFLKIWDVAVGSKLDLSDPKDRKKLSVETACWVAAGKPMPKMPETLGPDNHIPMKLYRVKWMGKQYLAYKDTKGKWHNMEEDSNGRRKYTVPFDKEEAQKLVDDAIKRCENPTFAFKHGTNNPYQVTAEDFASADFDAVIKQHRRNDYHM